MNAFVPTVTVTGNGTASAAPDVARIRCACTATTPSVADAVAAQAAAVTRVREALASRGIGGADAPTGRMTISAKEVWENGESRLVGYTAEQQITVSVRALADVGEVLAQMVAAAGDAMRLHGVDFEVQDTEALRAQARDAAFTQALAEATQYAARAGRTLGAVMTIGEAPDGMSPRPMPMAKAQLMAPSSDALPVEPGETNASATVTVTWELV